jgi:hypothetical protein
MERRFGQDFSRVRVHTDARAAESVRAVNAYAYTVGHQVVFGDGRYAPATPHGQMLIAHELTHVVQQGQADRPVPSTIGPENDSHEAQAQAVSDRLLTDPLGHDPVSVQPIVPGTVQGGWPLIVGAAVGVGAGIYAIWAYKCLKPLEPGMYTATFGNAARDGGFRLWYYNHTMAPVPSNIWDGFGHCWIACESTKKCGSFTAAIAGKGREFAREYLDSDPHDSYEQDTNNQTLGRGFGSSGANCTVQCENAALPGGSLDQTAPQASFWTPIDGDYTP